MKNRWNRISRIEIFIKIIFNEFKLVKYFQIEGPKFVAR